MLTAPGSQTSLVPPQPLTDFIGRGLTFPIQVNDSGSIALTSGPSDLDAAVRMVLLTAPGERVMRPEFVCRIQELAFESINTNTLGLMKLAVHQALVQWEPRITVTAVEVVPDPGSPGLVQIHLEYQVRATNDRRNLVHPFYLIPPESIEKDGAR